MLYEEAKKASVRKTESGYYKENLAESKRKKEENLKRKKVITPEDMPWENSPQGTIKHLYNEKMDAHVEAVDAYMQFLPPGSRSGKHRHMSEEFIFVLEGKGYDLHWDVDYECDDKYYWKVEETPSRWEWEQGDSTQHGASAFQCRTGNAGAVHIFYEPYDPRYRVRRFGTD
jgi:hypothetical protein